MAEGFWVFGYGSLMWRPGFAFAAREVATLSGYVRRFCLASIRYRGTPEAPGLVLALAPEPGGACTGIAYRVEAREAEAVLACLRERELVTYAYAEARRHVRFGDGSEAEAVVYLADPAHPQFRGGLTLAEQARIIATAAGPSGTNRDYLESTLAHLAAIGISDPDLLALGAAVRARVGLSG
jgi:cation transport protein ChaC